MRAVKVTFSDGDTITTDINGTDIEIKEYYKIGRVFNLGNGELDRMVKVVSVEILNDIETSYQNYITCPYCGWVDKESWRHSKNDQLTCKDCNRLFKIKRDEVIVYSTFKISKGKTNGI